MKEKVSVLISSTSIQKRVEELAEQISKDYLGQEIALVCVLKGGAMFMIDLAKHITNDVTMEFIAVSSYGNAQKSTGVVTVTYDLQTDISGKHVLLVEDILDTGRTLEFLLNHLKQRNPLSLRVCTLLDKPTQRVCNVTVDYVGFEVPDQFVIGYGLDYEQRYRNLPYIGLMSFVDEE